MSDSLLHFHGVDIGFGNTVLIKDLHFHLNKGDFLAIVGPNGSGKSTLLKTLVGLIPPVKGKVSKLNGTYGYVPQNAVLNTSIPLNASEFLELKSDKKLNSVEQKQLLNRLEITDEILNKPLNMLSPGMKQRILLAFTLLSQPTVLCLDEATDGLDFKAQMEFFKILKDIRSLNQTAVILVSHDITAVSSNANRAICLNQAVLFDGDPRSNEFHSCLHGIYGKDSFIHHHNH